MKKKKTKPNKYTLLHRSNERFARKNLELLSENSKLKDDLVIAENKLDDITQVKEMTDETDLSGELACAGGSCEITGL